MATIAVCAGVVVLMLALASLLERLRDDPGTVGKRYQLTLSAPEYLLPSIRAIPGVDAAGARYSVEAADSFRLGEPLRLVAYPGDHTEFEAPPLARGPARALARARSRSGSGWPTRSGCGPAPRSPPSCRAARRSASASPGSCARSRTTAGSAGCGPSGCSRATPTWSRASSCGWTRAPTAPPSRAR